MRRIDVLIENMTPPELLWTLAELDVFMNAACCFRVFWRTPQSYKAVYNDPIGAATTVRRRGTRDSSISDRKDREACVGRQVSRLLVIIAVEGDGGFQMTGHQLSTLLRYDKSSIVFVINNRAYTDERLIHDGRYNDIQDWRYYRLPEIYDGVVGEGVHTESDLEDALKRAESHTGPGPLLIEAHLDAMDAPKRSLE